VQNSSQYFLPYTTFTFQPGYHKVNYSNNVLIKDVNNITLIGEMHASSMIQCISTFGLTFMNVTNITISNLQFELCGAPIPHQPRLSIIKLLPTMNLTATLYFMQVSEIRISDVQVRNSTGVGLLGINALLTSHHFVWAGRTAMFSKVTINDNFPTLVWTRSFLFRALFQVISDHFTTPPFLITLGALIGTVATLMLEVGI